jgi:hypothetical protein
MNLYSVSRWNEIYENNRSRLVKELSWVPVPNSHDGEAYNRIITSKDGAEVFAAWILILQVASRCHLRGSLVRRNDEPHDAQSLSLKTRAPASWFEKALPALVSCGWLECKRVPDNELALDCREPDACMTPSCPHGDDRTEQNRTERTLAGNPPGVRASDLELDGTTAEAIYAAYPRKTARPVALRAISKAMREKSAGWLLERVLAYGKAVRGTEERFIPHPATWFNGQRYNDPESSWNPDGRKLRLETPEPNGWREAAKALWPTFQHHQRAWSDLPPSAQERVRERLSSPISA